MEQLSTERTELAKTLRDKAENSSYMLSYLEHHYPIPTLNPANCINIDGAANAYSLHDLEANKSVSINFMISPSCTGQDSVIDYLDTLQYPNEKVTTATTRDRRPEEDESAYTWMKYPADLSENQIVDYLIAHYHLVECQKFGVDYYGTPLESLKQAMNNPNNKPVIVKNDQYGVHAIKKSTDGDINLNTIAMIPDSYQHLWDRLVALRRNNPIKRITEAAIFMTQFEEVSDYVLLNQHHENARTGIQQTAQGLVDILQSDTLRGHSCE